MKQITNFLKINKKAAILLLFFLVIFIGFSVTNAIKVSNERADADNNEQKTSETSESEDTETIPVDDVSLTDKQSDIIDNYSAKTQQLIDVLAKHPWVSDDGKNTIIFHDTYYEQSVNGHSQKTPFAISAIEYDSNGSDTEINTLVFETDKGTHLVTYTATKAVSENEKGVSTLYSTTLFEQGNTTYTRVEEFTNITIQGLDEEISAFLGDTKELSRSLSEWCALRYPSMTTAVWNKSVSVQFDEQAQTVTSAFYLGTSQEEALKPDAPLVTVVFEKSTNTYTYKI